MTEAMLEITDAAVAESTVAASVKAALVPVERESRAQIPVASS
jgi:hypothetical protein